jgi:hypothetical protein
MKNLTSLHFLQKEWLVLVCMAAMILLAFPGAVQALPAGLIPSPPQVAAESYVLVDAMTGTVLAEKNSNQQLPPASLTMNISEPFMRQAFSLTVTKLSGLIRFLVISDCTT